MPNPNVAQIGLTYAGMVNVSTLYKNQRDKGPRCMPINYPENAYDGNGARIGQGGKTQVWRWGFLSIGMWDDLKDYKNVEVYIRTFDPTDGVWKVFTAMCNFPDEEPEIFASIVQDADITFRFMVQYTEPE